MQAVGGSPPQVRGKLRLFGLLGCARWDHPRRCGENLIPKYQHIRYQGSPPQVRGKPSVGSFPVSLSGITPAGAGKTLLLSVLLPMIQDHPRRCGENTDTYHPHIHALGSPPQVRGKPSREEVTFFLPRITPAGAGKTRRCRRGLSIYKDHPRRCGENFAFAVKVVGVSGSPPQVRGKLKGSTLAGAYIGITPAGAGKTAPECQCPKPLEDHPRRCGENAFDRPLRGRALGSPPQVRGKQADKFACFVAN